MRLPETYIGKDNTQVFLSSGFPIGPNTENPLEFVVAGKVLRSTDRITEIQTPRGLMLIRSEIITGAFVGNPHPTQPVEAQILTKNKAAEVVKNTVRK